MIDKVGRFSLLAFYTLRNSIVGKMDLKTPKWSAVKSERLRSPKKPKPIEY